MTAFSAETRAMIDLMRPIVGEVAFDRAEQSLILPDDEPRYSLRSNKILVMLFAARAGSTYAGQLIGNLPQFGYFSESLNPRSVERVRERRGHPNHSVALQYTLRRHGKEMFGFRTTPIGLASAALTGFFAQFHERMSFVILRRKDIDAQAVSMVLARASGQFSSLQRVRRKVTIDDYDFDAIERRRKIVEDIYERHHRLLEALGETAPTVYYEDILADPSGFVGNICAHLGIDAPDTHILDTRVSKLPNAIKAEWLRRYKEAKAAEQPATGFRSRLAPIVGLARKKRARP